ncbi:hypothetical protein J132_06957 [Termitomyces sp. J132]|nr:hypothetical protein H2248_006156 [Termitomyces sp. 'cryptogamus']KNZ74445.1 hypothetical protein J132_06957 [Termitomyces sp. J132]
MNYHLTLNFMKDGVIMKNLAVCRLKILVHVRIVPEDLKNSQGNLYCPDASQVLTLDAGAIIKAFNPQPIVLTGQGPESFGYRIEGTRIFTVYQPDGMLIECTREQFYHENFRAVGTKSDSSKAFPASDISER